MQKILLKIGVFILAAIAAFYIFNNYIYQEKQADQNQPVVPYPATLTGEHICLPHTNTNGPQTLECAFGLKTDSGEYYALDFGSQIPTDLSGGSRYTITGTITPVEMLSSDQWQKYPIEGILSVESVQKL